MKTKFCQVVLLCLAFVGIASVVNAQTKIDGYNPFIDGNMDGFTTNNVTENSIHTYTYTGDVNLMGSTFVFNVVGGTIIKGVGDETPETLVETNGAGTHSVLEADNKGSIVVKWSAEEVGVQKYVAVYELSSTGCILNNAIAGYKISVGTKPTLALAMTGTEACSSDDIAIDLTVTNGTSPWTVVVNDGTKDITFYFSTGDVTGSTEGDYRATVTQDASKVFTYSWAAPGADYLNTNTNGADVSYTFTAKSVDDAITSAETNDTGVIVPGSESVEATVHPLPVIGTMGQDI